MLPGSETVGPPCPAVMACCLCPRGESVPCLTQSLRRDVRECSTVRFAHSGKGLKMGKPLRGSVESNALLVAGHGLKPLAPGQGAAKMGLPRDIMSEDWAVRNHPHALYLKQYEDGSVRMARGRVVDSKESMCTGGTVVRGKSRKGKFVKKAFVYTNAKSDSRIDPAPVVYRQPDPLLVAPRHAGTPIKTVKHVPPRSEAGR